MKDTAIASNAVCINAGLSNMFCREPALVKIPIIGGMRIKAKKIMTAER
jgi:hypothetical protein